MFTPNTYAASNVTLNLNVITKGTEGSVVNSTEFVVPFGNTTTLNLNGLGLTGTKTAIMVHNDQIVPTSTSFVMSASLNLSIIVKDSEDDYVAVFVDTNGELVDVDYNPIDEPSTLVSLSKPGYNAATFDTFVITKDTIFLAEYVKSNESSIAVTILGGTKDLIDPKYNDVVTITSTTPGFTHWEDENGNVVSYKNPFIFTALEDISLQAMTNGASQPNVYMRDVTGIRSGHDSILGYVEFDTLTYNLIEYGFIASSHTGPILLSIAQKIPSQSITQNNEFLRSFVAEQFSQYVAYAMIKDITTEKILTIYSNGYIPYEFNLNINVPTYTPDTLYLTGSFNNWNTSSYPITINENDKYINTMNFLVRDNKTVEMKILSGTDWENQAYYGQSRNLTPANRIYTFDSTLLVDYDINVVTWRSVPISASDPVVAEGFYRVYYFTGGNSGPIKIHNWGVGGGTSWPGDDMIFSKGYYYYDIPVSRLNFIFNNGSGKQTDDLVYDSNLTGYYYTHDEPSWDNKLRIVKFHPTFLD